MVDRLAGCYVKLARARAHLDALRAAVVNLFGAEPERIPAVFDAATGNYVIRAQRSIVIPLEWSAIAGDVVHNLYAALDYLAWELVAVNGGTGTRSTAFPIFPNEAAYKNGALRRVDGMHPDAKDLIEQLQPFRVSPRDQHPNDHQLTRLYGLEMQDKHRSLNLVIAGVGLRPGGLPAHVYQAPDESRFVRRAYTAGSVLGTISNFEPGLGLYLDVSHWIAFDGTDSVDGADVLKTLTEISRFIEERVIPPFLRFF
jgi:hypothetical protein